MGLPDGRLTRRRLIGGLVAGALAGCSRAPAPERATFLTFATEVNVTIYDSDTSRAQRAIAELQALYAVLNRDWYAWGDGELARINAALASTTQAPVSAELATLLERAAALSALSGGRFDPAVGNLVRLWGFDRFDKGQPPVALPGDEALAQALATNRGGFTLQRDSRGARLQTLRPGLVIDLGGIAKGAALALGMNALALSGVERALIDAGGDLFTMSQSDRSPFRIGLRDPRNNAVARRLRLLPGEAVMSSGDYARFWELDGQRYQHIIDPRNGLPVSAARAATVISTDPVLADAAATALIVGGRNDFSALCDAMGIDKALMIDNLGQELVTPPMRARLEA